MDALRKRSRSVSRCSLFSVILLLGLLLLTGWGATGHRIINRNGVYELPAEMLGFIQRAAMLSDSASNADSRKSRDPSESPIDYVFSSIYESNRYVDSILRSDNYAKQISGWDGSGQEPASYYTALWSAAGGFTIARMQGAVDAFANLLFTSWVHAGRPPVPITVAVDPPASTASEFRLDNAFPNPFNPVTTIRYHLTQARFVELEISDVQGARVALLVSSVQRSGIHTAQWDASASPSGVYFCRLRVTASASSPGTFVATKKLVLMK